VKELLPIVKGSVVGAVLGVLIGILLLGWNIQWQLIMIFLCVTAAGFVGNMGVRILFDAIKHNMQDFYPLAVSVLLLVIPYLMFAAYYIAQVSQ
jgi:hypothetical protein